MSRTEDSIPFPKGFSEEARTIFRVIHGNMRGITKEARKRGLKDDILVSAIMSATITELVNIQGCPHCTALILGEAAVALMESFEGAKDDDPIH